MIDLTHTPAPDWVSDCGDVVLYHGDCLELLPQFPAGCVDAVVTDPQYGVGLEYDGGNGDSMEIARDLLVGMIDATERIARVRLTTVGRYAIELFLYQHRPPVWRLCWRKGITSRPCAVGFTDWEPVFVYGHDVHRHAHDLFTAQPARMGDHGHPCPKSLAWATWLVTRFSADGEVVADTFMGSGTTGVASVKTGRKFIGIEIERKYFDIAVGRIERAIEDVSLFRGVAEPVEEQPIIFDEGQAMNSD